MLSQICRNFSQAARARLCFIHPELSVECHFPPPKLVPWRRLSKTAPYMHDGSLPTLLDVVKRYNQGGIQNPYLDPEIRPLNLTLRETRDLVEFLESLTGNIRYKQVNGQSNRSPENAEVNETSVDNGKG